SSITFYLLIMHKQHACASDVQSIYRLRGRQQTRQRRSSLGLKELLCTALPLSFFKERSRPIGREV
ncbi:hypothetical protein ACR79B_20260, partial [Sphingobacterium spiritivorum]|uniref:hypothetical protein n=1 Tax=Sphingobacterium spiritivorum TaxID=258 RepID=UPI003DA2C40C